MLYQTIRVVYDALQRRIITTTISDPNKKTLYRMSLRKNEDNGIYRNSSKKLSFLRTILS